MEQQNNQLEKIQFNYFDSEQFAVMQRISTMFSQSELVPDMYRASDSNPKEKAIANCMIALEISQRIGASALMVMQNLTIIYGRPSWSSKFLIATVNTCGRFKPLQYKFKDLGKVGKIPVTVYKWVAGQNGAKGRNQATVETFDGDAIDNVECIAYSTGKGSDEVMESSPVSIKMAIQEGWYTKAGSKWPNMPKKMLIYRAASFWTNEYAPELSMGMRTEEESADIGDTVDAEFDLVSSTVKDKMKGKANVQPMGMNDNDKAGATADPGNTGTADPAKKPEEPKTDNPI